MGLVSHAATSLLSTHQVNLSVLKVDTEEISFPSTLKKSIDTALYKNDYSSIEDERIELIENEEREEEITEGYTDFHFDSHSILPFYTYLIRYLSPSFNGTEAYQEDFLKTLTTKKYIILCVYRI
ncbi:hypothetical protein [Neptunitalea lumnitzerae]|uniref:Uncharacterized protein n=1 Tax=Neptunitalea lumnitzerae TaxID=2965509 RepID=A0ABQ5MKU0_9FLAO|nr:hypothetical protein [Neptunitalea sp. Y10]GLB49670.1 hypothetical protein Y10_20380 [Neptunitalea sp. Y10]